MADFSVRSDHIDVEQIMRQIRARVRDKRGADYTEAEIRELANVKLDKFLDPKAVRSDLLLHYRQQRRPANEAPMPLYAFDPSVVYTSDRGTPGRILTLIRKLLNPILKLFFNPSPLLHVVHLQTQINDRVNKALVTREEFDALNFEMFNNLVVELTRLGIEVRNLRMQVESFGTRLDFDERRARALEGAVQYKPGAPVQRPPQPQAAAAAAVTSTSTSPGTEEPAAGADDEEGAEGGESGRARRRRRRRGRRRGQGGVGEGAEASEGQAEGQAESQAPSQDAGQGASPSARQPREQEARISPIDTAVEEPAAQPFVPETETVTTQAWPAPPAAAPAEPAVPEVDADSFWASIDAAKGERASAAAAEPVEPEPPSRQWHRVTSDPGADAAIGSGFASASDAEPAAPEEASSPWPLADSPEPEPVPPSGHWPEAEPLAEHEQTHAHHTDAPSTSTPVADATSAPDRIVSHTDDEPDEPARS